jgi:hypothetical protein
MLKNSSKKRHWHYFPIFEQIFPVKKQIVYQAKKFGICIVSIKKDRIVHDRSNIAVT